MDIQIIRHSLAHILALAVKELYPKVKLGMGPAIENGFYYDFEFLEKINDTDLVEIEKKMREIILQDIKFAKKSITKIVAKKLFKGQPYKLEILKELPGKTANIYINGEFTDLCKGPHVKSSKELRNAAFKLTKTAGAYWKGDEKNKMLTRIYGIAFEIKKELEDYIKFQEEAEKRDHRILGEKLELFMFDSEVGSGLPLWLPKGAILRKTIENYLYKELSKQGYQWLVTPHIGNINLWKTSGHWNFYRENIYSPIKIENEEYLLKPMNCPFHLKVYNSKIRSYRDLPIRYAELGTVYRFERSGTLHGLTRVRGFTQDDAHIICTPEQLTQEVEKLLHQGLRILKEFGFENYTIYLSTRPEKYAGTLAGWKKATDTLKCCLNKLNIKFQTDEGGGVFYGPKIDIKIKDSLNREWQCTTIQFDFNLPERFKMSYIDEKGKKREPFMIHRALLGSMERFIGVLLEHYAGALPAWLSPIQTNIIPVGSGHKDYAKEIFDKISESGIRVELSEDNLTVGKRIMESEIRKVPFTLVVGDKEMNNKTVSVRERGDKKITEMPIEEFIEKIKK